MTNINPVVYIPVSTVNRKYLKAKMRKSPTLACKGARAKRGENPHSRVSQRCVIDRDNFMDMYRYRMTRHNIKVKN